MNKTLFEIVESNFDMKFNAEIYSNIKVALEAHQRFLFQNKNYFSYNKKNPLMGYLRGYAIEKQFNNSAFCPRPSYSVSMKEVNNFKYKPLFLETEDCKINLGKTMRPNTLLSKSKYKERLASSNSLVDVQYCINLENDSKEAIEEKKYAQIAYGYNNGDLMHLNIVIPDSGYKYCLHSINLLENIKKYDSYVSEDLVEENIVFLKEILEEEAKNKVI